MEAELRTTTQTPANQSKKEAEKQPAKEIEGYEMLVGEGMESEEARNDFIDSVEKILEFESLERGQQHSRKNFDHAARHSEMFRHSKR